MGPTQAMKYWLMDGPGMGARLVYVGDWPSDCKREWLHAGRRASWSILEMPAGDEVGLEIKPIPNHLGSVPLDMGPQ